MLGIKFTDNTCERLNIHRTLQEKKKTERYKCIALGEEHTVTHFHFKYSL